MAMQKHFQKAYTRQFKSIVDEATKAGGTLVHEWNYDFRTSQSALNTVKALFSQKTRANYLQFFHFNSGGFHHIYAQPFEDLIPLPGEHHALLSTSWSSPLILRDGSFGAKWSSLDETKALEKRLGKDKTIKKAISKLKWKWPTGTGAFEFKWLIQTCALGNGTSHVVLQAGRYGGFTSYKVGFPQFLELCKILTQSQAATSQAAPQNFLQPTAFGSEFIRYIQDSA